jgi:hypothetical protein
LTTIVAHKSLEPRREDKLTWSNLAGALDAQ